ncbi:MAG: PD-(D/E)XK nuclease family protein [Cyanobacteria bacterium P01_F01_bin.150]
MLQLSQSQLTLIEQCPRKFQYLCLDQLAAPILAEQRGHLTRGSQVHYLMQQHELQLPQDALQSLNRHSLANGLNQGTANGAQQDQLYQIVQALTEAVPDFDDATVFRQSEYRITLNWRDVLLTVVYDLLLLNATNAYIFDWKTYLSPPNLQQLRQRLVSHWQTKLYPFVLVETSDYPPEAVEISYWFVKRRSYAHRDDEAQEPNNDQTSLPERNHRFESECLTFTYSDRLHQQTKQELAHLLGQLHHWLDDYRRYQPLPKVDATQGICSQCSFQMRCDRANNASTQENWEELGDISAIPEVQPLPITEMPLT